MKDKTLKYSRESQKLIYWLISDYANFQNGNNPGSKVGDYQLSKSKKELKKMYLKSIKYEAIPKPIEWFIDIIDKLENDFDKQDLKLAYVKSIQDFAIKVDEFSLMQSLMSQEGANRFIRWLIDMFMDNDITFRTEVADLMKKSDENSFIYVCLKYKRCVVCGKHGEIHHVEQVGSAGYKSDYGQLEYSCLCREHHSEVHADGRVVANGIKLNEKQLEVLKGKYKNHFKGSVKSGKNQN